MKKNLIQKVKNMLLLVLPLLIISLLSACSKMDDYKKFTEGGEFSYTGKLDSVNVISGKYRAIINGLFIADPKVKKCVIYWNNKVDSVVIPITRTSSIDTLNYSINNLTEGIYNFIIYTYDGDGNRSIPVYKTGRVYGDRYQGSLMNRDINVAVTDESNKTEIQWSGMDRLSGVFATEVIYKDVDDEEHTIRTSIDQNTTLLTNFKESSSIRYRTLFLPDTTCIDTFYTDFVSVYIPKFIKQDLTATYLKNAGTNFAYSSINSANRWGILADWATNSAIKNASGFGGFERKNNVGVLSLEAGWGLPNVTNGHIYQTITLPAGTYTFEIGGLDQNTGGTRYMLVAEGTTLPNVSNVTSEAIAFATLDVKIITFTLTEETTVSIGFAATLTGTSSTGQYSKIGWVKLSSIAYQ